MSLKLKLVEDMKTAMKARDMFTLGVIRFLNAQIKNLEIDEGEIDDDRVQKLIASEIKKMKDAISEFEKGGRSDLVEEEQKKVKVLEAYLPEQMSDEDLAQIVEKVIAENPEMQMGPLIGKVMQAVSGRADGGRVSSIVRSITL